MSKKITHKEVEKAIDKHTWLTGKLADWSGNDWSDLEEDYDFITNENIIINYIKQQEEVIKKQQKLLELYKEALETNFEGITLTKLVNKTLRTQKITHKEHRQLLSELYKKQGGKWIYQADAYIKQQEKQEQLLELYKKLSVIKNKIISLVLSDDDYDEMETIEMDIEKQIKELENE